MDSSIPPFVGNAPYCYANAVAMALAARGERVDPGVVEALTLVGVGAAQEDAPGGPLFYFSGGGLLPDTGIDHALECLGWGFEARWTAEPGDDPEGAAAIEALAEMLADGPVVLGPLDMGELAYQPGRADLVGADHFVVAYAIEGDAVRVHDPGGHPAVSLALPALVAAWRAERIWYRRGGFRMWGRFRRVASPTVEEAARRADETLGRLLRGQADGAGRAAWTGLAAAGREGRMAPALSGHLLWFALPVATRRAIDFAALLRPLDPDRAALQDSKASALGLAATALAADDLERFADRVEEAAAAEEAFVAATLAVGVG